MILVLLGCEGEAMPGDSGASKPGDTDTAADTATDSGDSGFGGDSGPFDPGDRSQEATVEPFAKVVGSEAGASGSGDLWLGGAADVDLDGRPDLAAIWGSEGTDPHGAGYAFPADLRGRWRVDEVAGSRFASASAGAGWDLDASRDGSVAVGVAAWYNGNAWGGRVVVLQPPVSGEYDLDNAGVPIDATCVYEHLTACLLGWFVDFGDNNGDVVDDLLVGNVYGLDLSAAILYGPFLAPVDAGAEAVAAFDVTVDGLGFADDLDGDGIDDVIGYEMTNAYRPVVYYGRLGGTYGAADADAILPEPWATAVSVGDLTGDGYPDLFARDGDHDAGERLIAPGPIYGEVDTSSMPRMTGGGGSRAFGWPAVGLGDLDEDGYADLVVAGPENGWSGPYTGGPGAAYLYFGPVVDGSGPDDADEVLSGDEDDGFGDELSNLGDVDGDGVIDLAVAGPGDDDGGEDAGAVWIYSGADLRVRR